MDTEASKFYSNSSLLSEFVPSIPPDFPKELLPEDQCISELIIALRCATVYGNNLFCSKDNQMFVECKRNRDLSFYKTLKEWETKKVLGMSSQSDQKSYVEGLRSYVRQLKEDAKKLPDTSKLDNKRWRFAADVEQYQWRADFLENAINNTAGVKK